MNRILSVRTTLATGVAAFALNAFALLPTFDNLETAWTFVDIGMTTERAIREMGPPTSEDESSTLGINHRTLRWIDIRLTKYEAKFAANRLYSKTLSRN
jgi:hypothetical protein